MTVVAPERESNFLKAQESPMSPSIPDLRERLPRFLEHWRNIVYEAQTSHGMHGSVDGRFSVATYTRDSATVANDEDQIHQVNPDFELRDRIQSSLVGIFDFQLPNGDLPHELLPFDPENEGYKKGFFTQNGKPDYMYNADTVEGAAHMLWVMPKYLGPQELPVFLSTGIKVLNRLISKLEENGGFLRYEYRDGENGLTHTSWMDSVYSVQHEDPSLNTHRHREGIMLPPAPIAPLEAQIHAWKALWVFAGILQDDRLKKMADQLKERFQKAFVVRDRDGHFLRLAHAVDGKGKQVTVPSINQAYALSIDHDGELIVELDDAVEIARMLMSPAMFDSRYGVSNFAKGHSIRGDDYHLGKNGDIPVFWLKAVGEVEEGTRDLAHILAMDGREEESAEMMDYSGKVALTMLNRGTNGVGTREGFHVKDDQIHFYEDSSTNPPTEHPECQTWSASALRKASYNPVVQELLNKRD